MKMNNILATALATFALVSGCSKDGAQKPASDKAGDKAGDKAAAPTGAVDVPRDGRKYEPPVKPEQLPSGAWYCDMGTVHYARMDEGDHTCPLCRMKLEKKP